MGKIKPKTVVILEKEYDYLIEQDKLLLALQSAGVDNWEGYDFAIEAMKESDDEED